MICTGFEPADRLVQDEQPRSVDDGLRDAHALAEAMGQRRNQVVAHALELRGALDDRGPALGVMGGQPAKACRKHEKLVHGHLAVERRRVGQVADAAPDLVRLIDDVDPVDEDRPRRGEEVAGEHAQRRRFSGAVQAE